MNLNEADKKVSDYFRANTLTYELFGLVAGDIIGSGAFRHVFDYSPDPKLVIKFELDAGSFHNVQEWTVWDRVKNAPDLAKWFAPCRFISPCGSILLQEYAKDLLDTELPEEVPAYFTDVRKENWGKIGKKIVCRDYGSHLLYEKGMTKSMRKVKWIRPKATPVRP
jgi:hypothetical protein